jgi:FixJ family two-component response regulator
MIQGFAAAAMSSPRDMELQRAIDFQAALLAMAGHDLRQPLQVLHSTYEWLGTHIGACERARLQRGERAIARITEQLDRLLGALRLYEYTRRIELAPVAIEPLLGRIAAEHSEAAAENGVELRVCGTGAVIMSNGVLLDGILRNLMRNAVKYTEPGGRILIGCRRSSSEVRIDVYDTGIGMVPEQLPRIFEAFHRIDETRGDGLGIGLFVVRRAVALLGHRIEVRSAVGRGSRFSIVARVSMMARPEGRTDSWSLIPWFDLRAGRRHAKKECIWRGWHMSIEANETAVVYIIDDDDSLRRALDRLFRSVGLQTRAYGSVREFLDAGVADSIGCIVLDVRLPGMSGRDFQAQLADLGIHLPVVLMTGHGDIPMSVRAMKAGAVDFLPKPFRDQDMLDAATAAIERDRARWSAEGDAAELRNRYATLSPREREVMLLVTAGKMNKQVAGDLGLSEVTVKIHRAAAMRKMGARTLADLVRMADALKSPAT